LPVEVFALYCSPRLGGNSDTLLDEALNALREAEPDLRLTAYNIYDKRIGPCNACEKCFDSGVCTIRDDFPRMYERIMAADIVLIASPIYFMGPPAPLKAFIDRCLCGYTKKMSSKKRPKRKRYGGLILTAGSPERKMFNGTISIIKALYWSLDIKYMGEVLAGNMDKKKAIKGHPRIIGKARKLALELLDSK
jgi:multimeric flavodoxin WrbA